MSSKQGGLAAGSVPCLLFVIVLFTGPLWSQVNWTEHMIDAYVYGTASIYVEDIDNDGDWDILGAVLEQSDIVWWRNDGGTPFTWTRFLIDGTSSQAISVYAADLDDDGDQDAIAAASVGDEVAWYENNGGNPITWTKYVIRSNYDFAHEVYAHDLDMDGDLDVLGAGSFDNLISWWRNDGGDPINWTEQTISATCYGAKSVRVADLDEDGDNDVVGAGLYDNDVSWWRNDGGDPIQWVEHVIDYNFAGAHRVQIVDIDEDNDDDILAVAYLADEIAWYSNDGGTPLTWTKQTIATDFEAACIAQAADLDGDGDLDVVGSAQTSNEVAWWRNDGGSPIVWTKFFIADTFERAWPLYVCDLDEDGDEDVLSGSSWAGIHEVRWWENLGTAVTENRDRPIPDHTAGTTIVSGPFHMLLDDASKIYTITGREVHTLDPAPGIYFLSKDGIIIEKLIKIK